MVQQRVHRFQGLISGDSCLYLAALLRQQQLPTHHSACLQRLESTEADCVVKTVASTTPLASIAYCTLFVTLLLLVLFD
jgi:hypothetical protein